MRKFNIRIYSVRTLDFLYNEKGHNVHCSSVSQVLIRGFDPQIQIFFLIIAWFFQNINKNVTMEFRKQSESKWWSNQYWPLLLFHVLAINCKFCLVSSLPWKVFYCMTCFEGVHTAFHFFCSNCSVLWGNFRLSCWWAESGYWQSPGQPVWRTDIFSIWSAL